MDVRLTRRSALLGMASLSMARGSVGSRCHTLTNSRIKNIEQSSGGRRGVAPTDTASGKRLPYRADERFAMCSTFKFLAAAAVLERVDRGQEKLDQWITYGDSDVLEYAPVAKEHAKE